MKTYAIILVISSVISVQAQRPRPGVPPNPNPPVASAPTEEYLVVERGPNHRVWAKVSRETNNVGVVSARTNSFVELATGMHYLQSGKWVESQEEFELLPGKAVARHGAHRVSLAANLNTASAIEMETPEGKLLRSHVLGLSYFDAASGKSVLIAEVKDCQARLLPPNVVIYTDAFTDFKADVRYTYTKAGFEQDIILHERPPGPEEWGLDPATTRLQVLTEFLNPPQPRRHQNHLIEENAGALQAGALVDEDLDFGSMEIARGKAFSLRRQDREISVGKQWLKLDGRDFLVEEVPVPELQEELEQLPAVESASLEPAADSIRHVVSNRRLMPAAPKLALSATNEIKVAEAAPAASGLVLDYNAINTSQSNFTFQSDSTYYVSASVVLYGSTRFEGGAVIKFTNNASITLVNMYLPLSITWATAAYRPVVFTAKDDDGTGDPLPMSSHSVSGYYANPALSYAGIGAQALSNARFMFAKQGMYLAGSTTTMSHVQFVNCQTALMLAGSGAIVRNGLFANNKTNLNASPGPASDIQNTTFSGSAYLMSLSSFGTLAFTNCVFANQTNLYDVAPTQLTGGANGFYLCQPFGANTYTNSSSPFQSVAGGNYYLSSGCNFRDVGTNAVDSTMLAALRLRTTYPPVLFYNSTLTTATNFSPQAQRDTNTVDLGYHYDPLDYIFAGSTANSNLTFTAGTAAGWYRTSSGWGPYGYGIHTLKGTLVQFTGTLAAPTYWVRANTVQESDLSGGYGPGGLQSWTGYLESGGLADAPRINAHFLRCSSLTLDAMHFQGWGLLKEEMMDCEFWGGGLGGYAQLCYFTNSFFDRCGIWLDNSDPNFPTIIMRNCLVRGGSLSFSHRGGVNWYSSIRDTAFDGTGMNIEDNSGGNTNYVDYDYNGFLLGAARTNPQGAHDVIVTNTFNWQASYFGNYYQPSNSLLINKGSRTADLARLYQYTTQTNQVKEGTSTVDIGYHYVAADGSGNPVDTNGNGIPDYLEDISGSGQLSITLISPLNNAYFKEPANVFLQASVIDWTGNVTKVDFLRGAVRITGVTSSPYQTSWPVVAAGAYTLSAVSLDANGLSLTSAPVNITVTNLCGF